MSSISLGAFANNLVLTWQLTGALGMEPMRSRPVRAWSAAKYGIVLHQTREAGTSMRLPREPVQSLTIVNATRQSNDSNDSGPT